MINCDVLVIGAGPAGLAAAISAHKNGADVLVLEREAQPGGILKQCIHDGFGLVRYKTPLAGPEYAGRFIDEFNSLGIKAKFLTFVTKIQKSGSEFEISAVCREGIIHIRSLTIVFATGCRERTAKQVFIQGTRPSGVFTAGTAQAFTNIYGKKVSDKCVILGSGDIGLIMARRLTLEGTEVVGVYEAKPTPSGLARNIAQCLNDFDIPLHLSKTVTRVFGDERLTGVEICSVDEKMQPIQGTEEYIECDALILSVGLIPENELAETLGVEMDPGTKGAVVDDKLMTNIPGVFCCGNCLHVNDLVDYVSESGETAGLNAAAFSKATNVTIDLITIKKSAGLAYIVPQKTARTQKTVFYFRSDKVYPESVLNVYDGDKIVYSKKYQYLRPPEMERLELDISDIANENTRELRFETEVR